MKLTVDENYYYKGAQKKKYFRVTNVISFLSPDIQLMKKLKPAMLEKACIKGTKAHELARLYALGKLTDIHEMAAMSKYPGSWECFLIYKNWFDISVKKVLAVEKFLFNDDLGVGGSCDLIALLNNGQVAVIDLKTGEKSKTHKLQTAAYFSMADKYKPTTRIIVYAKKKLKVEEHKYQDLDYSLYICAYNLYKHIILK